MDDDLLGGLDGAGALRSGSVLARQCGAGRSSAPGPRVRTVVSTPARAVYSAADTPAGPEPMMTMLDIVGLLVLLVLS